MTPHCPPTARGLLYVVVAAFVLLLAGCATSLTIERISPSGGQSDYVRDVTSAYRQPSGAVVVCVVGTPAQTPSPFGSRVTAFSLTLPPGASVSVPKSVRREIPRFQVTAANVGAACPQNNIEPAISIPVRRIESSRIGDRSYFNPDYDEFTALLGPDSEGSAVWTVYTGYTTLFYVSESPRFEGRRAVKIQTYEREVEGQPAYLALLPFAVAFDVLMVPVYLLWALAGGLHGH